MSKFKKGDTVWHPWIRTTGPKTFTIYARTGRVTRTGFGTYKRDGDDCGVGYGDKEWVEYIGRTTTLRKASKEIYHNDCENACFHTRKEALEYLKTDVDKDSKRDQDFQDNRIKDCEDSIERSHKSIETYKESFALEQRIAAEKHAKLDDLLGLEA